MSLLVKRPALTALAFFLALTVGTSLAGSASAQSKFKEAPMLAEQVKAGKLPPVEQRLPSDPLVVPVVERTGQYGGVWRRAFLGPADFNNYVRVVYDALARFSPDGGQDRAEDRRRAGSRRRTSRPGRSSSARARAGRTARPSPRTTSCSGTRTSSSTRT